jgi:hypothetical protein
MSQAEIKTDNTEEIVADDETLLDLDNLDNLDLSTVDAAPEFLNEVPKGIYTLKVVKATRERKKNKKGEVKVRIRHIYAIDSVVQLEDKEALIPATGSLVSETFMATKEGLTYWKTRAEGILHDLGNAKFVDVLNMMPDAPVFKAALGTRTSEEDGTIYKNLTVQVIKQQ